MDFFRAKLIVIVLALGLIAGGIVGIIFYYLFPEYFPQWFGGSLLFLLVIESLIVAYTEKRSLKASARQLTNVYMLTKFIKILVSLIYITIYAAIVKEGIKNFVLVFIILYLLFLFIETYIFMKIEKHIKGKKTIG